MENENYLTAAVMVSILAMTDALAKLLQADWALESLAIVRAQVYRLPALGEINPTYIEPARAVIRTRLAQAGARLAVLLNQTFPQ